MSKDAKRTPTKGGKTGKALAPGSRPPAKRGGPAADASSGVPSRRVGDRGLLDEPLENVDRMVNAATSRVTMGLSPASVMMTHLDWLVHLAASPGKQVQLAEKAARKAARLGAYAARSMVDPDTPPAIEPLPQDRRFDHPGWRRFPFNLAHQAFLLNQQWWHNATTDIRGVSEHNEESISFITRQLLDMVSPSNFPFLNPEIIEATIKEGGANLKRGAHNLLEDARRAASPVLRSKPRTRSVAQSPLRAVMTAWRVTGMRHPGLEVWRDESMRSRRRWRTRDAAPAASGNGAAHYILPPVPVAPFDPSQHAAPRSPSRPGGKINPFALKTLWGMHPPSDGYRSKDWAEFARPGAPELDFVITVCDKAAGEVWPGPPMTAHLGVADPAAFEGSDAQKADLFWDTAMILERRIELMLALPLATMDRMSLQREIRGIGTR